MPKIETTEFPIKQELKPSELLSVSDVIVFDMDGTLYLLDGDNYGYQNSSLYRLVSANAQRLITERENLSEESANKLIAKILSQNQHLSQVLGKKYGLNRQEYFNIVWDIDPQGILNHFEASQTVIRTLHQTGKEIILLTSGPQIWQNRVIDHLGLNDCFTQIYTGEDFVDKDEVFTQLSLLYPKKRFLSIGDQLQTDILPAQALGMNTYHINHPNDLLLLLK